MPAFVQLAREPINSSAREVGPENGSPRFLGRQETGVGCQVNDRGDVVGGIASQELGEEDDGSQWPAGDTSLKHPVSDEVLSGLDPEARGSERRCQLFAGDSLQEHPPKQGFGELLLNGGVAVVSELPGHRVSF